jgi:hypothetical protein
MIDEDHMQPEIVATPAAAAFVRERGGRLFVWLDEAGLKCVSTDPPEVERQFRPVYASGLGFSLYEDEQIGEPATWKIVFRRFPHRHADALWNGYGGVGGDGAVPPPSF